jgi:DNA-binding beta-propeller fold protein YncE
MSRRLHVLLAAAPLLCLSIAEPAVAQSMPSPVLLVGEKDAGLLAIVDPATLEIVARVPANPNPHEVASDGRFAYVSNSGAGAITVIDLESAEQVDGIELAPLSPVHGLWVSGGKLWFANEASRTIGRYDPALRRIDQVLGTGQALSHMLVVNRDASRIFTTNLTPGTVSKVQFDDRGRWEISTIPTGARVEGLALSPDEREFWVTNVGDGTISVIETDAFRVIATIDLPTRYSNRLTFSPDGSRVIVSDLRGTEVLVIDRSTRSIVAAVDVGGGSEGLLVTPDGATAFISVSTAGHVEVLDLRTLTVTGRIAGFSNPDGIAWVAGP